MRDGCVRERADLVLAAFVVHYDDHGTGADGVHGGGQVIPVVCGPAPGEPRQVKG
jgi:hypothetical protein